ncbi:MAG: PQQ-binding-like beta-propeller repeat protein [Aureliella sp.]
MGPSYSGPIVSDDRVFVTESKDEKFEVVRALDRNTGQQLWETQWEGAMKVPFFAASNGSWIRATPALDGDRLYVAGMKDVLVCLDVKTGAILWKLDFASETGSPLPDFGFASSPLVHGDHLYVQAGASFTKLDKFTGNIVWQTLKDDGGMNGSAFSSPVFARLAGVDQFVVQTRSNLAGVSPEDGAVLWSHEVNAFRGMNILTPTVIGDSLFTSSYGGRSSLFRIDRDDKTWRVTEEWSHKSQGYMSSPLVIDGHIYLHLKNQRFVCLDASSGVDLWTTTPFGKYWSMVSNGNMILALDEVGELILIHVSPEEFKLVDRVTVADNAWAHIAIVGEQIFVRNLDEIKAFSWK